MRSNEDAARVVDAYLARWGIEKTNRFIKQGFDLEAMRALTWTGLKLYYRLLEGIGRVLRRPMDGGP